ncbi:MAG: sulfate ABC transporter substrate-binding protein [Rhizonema sp. PD37]|nr:sulfate ABC transporter substrate-binding protein [Rhizonema sp. PD37]
MQNHKLNTRKFLLQPWKNFSIRKSTLLVATGLTVSGILPVDAGITLQKQQPNSATQIISQNKPLEVTLVSYAVTKEAYSKIIPLFTQKWKKEHNQEVTFQQSYGGSGTQARAVIDGLEADVVALALGFDVEKIQKAGLIKSGWENKAPNGAIVTRSAVVLVTRPGNPKKINGWADLTKPGISVITANPKTSGGARWNFLALWGSVMKTGGNEAKARDYVTKVYKNVAVLPKDSRESSDTFYKRNQGDVLLNYENEEILAKLKGESNFPTVLPPVNISIDNPVAVVDKVVDKRGTRQVTEAFVKFLFTPEAQREFAKVGFRPVNSTVNQQTQKQFSKISNFYTVKDFGGWDTVQKKFFDDGSVFDQIQGGRR